MSARLRGGRNEPERRRGNISGNEEIARFGSLIAENTDAAVVVFFTHRADEIIIQHQLGVIAALRGLFHGGFSLGEKTREKQRAFYLRAGDG